MLHSSLAPGVQHMPADISLEIFASHKEQHMTAPQVQQAEVPLRAAPMRKLTREVSSAISESAAKRSEAMAAMEAQVSETKLSLEVSDIMLATARPSKAGRLPAGCIALWAETLALLVQRVIHRGC